MIGNIINDEITIYNVTLFSILKNPATQAGYIVLKTYLARGNPSKMKLISDRACHLIDALPLRHSAGIKPDFPDKNYYLLS
jgi:hypothetical protein